jgi:hypothetical protein
VRVNQPQAGLVVVAAAIFEPCLVGIIARWDKAELGLRRQHRPQGSIHPAVFRNDLIAVESKLHRSMVIPVAHDP